MTALNKQLWFFITMIIMIAIGYFIGSSYPVQTKQRLDPNKIAIKDSLDSCIIDLSTKKSMLEKTIHWEQLELMDLLNKKRK
jgi:hypothetical protein